MDFSQAAQKVLDNKTKPVGSLGRLEEVAVRLATLQQTLQPSVAKKRLFVFAGSHGVTASGVSLYPAAVTGQMVRNFVGGGAAINVLARLGGIDLRVIDVGVDDDLSDIKADNFFKCRIRNGTRNFVEEPAMTAEECDAAIEVGRAQAGESLAQGVQLLGVGEMGIGNTTSASALVAGLKIVPAEESTGRGTGMDEGGVALKARVVAKALEFHRAARTAKDWLRCVGGYEVAAMTGVILEAAERRVPVVVDGFISTAAAAIAIAMEPGAGEVCFFGHCSHEKAHRKVLDHLGAEPLLDLRMRLGEGTGAALAMHIIDASARVMCEMASFEQAGVSRSETV
jgi:nicotinate-nucleotide--dimethylbenzimidazole phosphoribosyltransferase